MRVYLRYTGRHMGIAGVTYSIEVASIARAGNMGRFSVDPGGIPPDNTVENLCK